MYLSFLLEFSKQLGTGIEDYRHHGAFFSLTFFPDLPIHVQAYLFLSPVIEEMTSGMHILFPPRIELRTIAV